MYNPRVAALELVGFYFGGGAVRAMAALLRANACLERLELRECALPDGALKAWAMAIEKNERLPLSSFRVYNEREARGAHADGLLRSLRAEGAAALGVAIANLPGSLHALELAGCGVTAKGVGVICDALQRHCTRFFTLPELHTLSLNHDGVEAERSVVSSLSSVLQRASGLKCLTVPARGRRCGSAQSLPSSGLLEELQARPPSRS